MANLAIKGHVSRGEEVIQILQMLGGKNVYNLCGDTKYAYYVYECGEIRTGTYIYGNEPHTFFTLEEFESKYPYKVGNKVIAYAEGCIAQFTIQDMRWSYELNKVEYKICSSWLDTSLIQSYKEETMEEKTDKAKAPNLIGEDYYGRRFGYKIPNGYEFDCIKNNEIILKPKQPQYPKTYEECARLINTYCGSIGGYNWKLLSYFQQLIVCRDAYWKIAGEQMGLGEPWKPDWKNPSTIKFCIVNTEGNITKLIQKTANKILAFPTVESRDAFYENFKELIEQCKELL